MPTFKQGNVTEMHILLRWKQGGYATLYSPIKARMLWIQRLGWVLIQLGCKIMFGWTSWEWYLNDRRLHDD